MDGYFWGAAANQQAAGGIERPVEDTEESEDCGQSLYKQSPRVRCASAGND